MKTKIQITGSGIMSKSAIFHAIDTTNATGIKDFGSNDRDIYFDKKSDANKALKSAYEKLSSDREDWSASMGNYSPGFSLVYDAGRANIVKI